MGRRKPAPRPSRLPVVTSGGVSSIRIPRRRRPRGRAAWKWTEKRRELGWLQDYLTMPKRDQVVALAQANSWSFREWAAEDSRAPSWLAERITTLEEQDDFAAIDDLAARLPERLLDGAFNSMVRDVGGDTISPSFVHMNFVERLPRRWLVHFSDDADSIACQGFTHGVGDHENLGLTTYIGKEAKKYGGYNFAFTAANAERQAKLDRWKYGSQIVAFTAPSVLVYHHGDQEYQAVFWGADARNLVHVMEDDGSDKRFCVGENRHGDPVFCADDFESIVAWLDVNYSKYEKQLSCGGSQPSADREHQSGRKRRSARLRGK